MNRTRAGAGREAPAAGGWAERRGEGGQRGKGGAPARRTRRRALRLARRPVPPRRSHRNRLHARTSVLSPSLLLLLLLLLLLPLLLLPHPPCPPSDAIALKGRSLGLLMPDWQRQWRRQWRRQWQGAAAQAPSLQAMGPGLHLGSFPGPSRPTADWVGMRPPGPSTGQLKTWETQGRSGGHGGSLSVVECL